MHEALGFRDMVCLITAKVLSYVAWLEYIIFTHKLTKSFYSTPRLLLWSLVNGFSRLSVIACTSGVYYNNFIFISTPDIKELRFSQKCNLLQISIENNYYMSQYQDGITKYAYGKAIL